MFGRPSLNNCAFVTVYEYISRPIFGISDDVGTKTSCSLTSLEARGALLHARQILNHFVLKAGLYATQLKSAIYL